MKKILSLSIIAVLCASCTAIRYSSQINTAKDAVIAVAAADLEVSPNRVEFTMDRPAKAIKRLGFENVLNAAVSKALEPSKSDVLVGTHWKMEQKLGGNIRSITVSGYPAKYKNFRPVDNEVIANIASSTNNQNIVITTCKKK